MIKRRRKKKPETIKEARIPDDLRPTETCKYNFSHTDIKVRSDTGGKPSGYFNDEHSVQECICV